MENKNNRLSIRAVAFWGIFVIVIGGMIFGMIKAASYNSTSKKESLVLTSPITAGDWVRGSKDAKVIIIEYSDFQCPACTYYYNLAKQAHKDFGDRIAIVYRHFPLRNIHANADVAALSAEAAGKQNKFWEMHDMIFETQENWKNEKNAQEIFIEYAGKLDLDAEQFKKDLDLKELKQKIEADYQSGVTIGVNHTPTIFVNGIEIQNPKDYEEFKQIINYAESKKS
ncbi:MAG: DsbA family protein [Patescibacteria group bacterium]